MTTKYAVGPSNMCAPRKVLHKDCDGTVVIWKSKGQMIAPGVGVREVVRCPCPICQHPPID